MDAYYFWNDIIVDEKNGDVNDMKINKTNKRFSGQTTCPATTDFGLHVPHQCNMAGNNVYDDVIMKIVSDRYL